MKNLKSTHWVKIFALVYVLFAIIPTLRTYINLGGIYLKGNVIIGSEDPHEHAFTVQVPNLSCNDVFLTAQHQFSMVVKWSECLREPYLLAYIFLSILPYFLIFLVLYYLDKVFENIEPITLKTIKLIKNCMRWMCLVLLVQSLFTILAEECKNAFFQKHIYFKNPIWHDFAIDKSNLSTILVLPIIVIGAILINSAKKNLTPE
jgi:hypothetical protein